MPRGIHWKQHQPGCCGHKRRSVDARRRLVGLNGAHPPIVAGETDISRRLCRALRTPQPPRDTWSPTVGGNCHRRPCQGRLARFQRKRWGRRTATSTWSSGGVRRRFWGQASRPPRRERTYRSKSELLRLDRAPAVPRGGVFVVEIVREGSVAVLLCTGSSCVAPA